MTRYINKILGLIFVGNTYKEDLFEWYSKILFLNIIIVLGVMFLVPYGVIAMLHNRYDLALVDLSLALTFCILFLYIRFKREYYLSSVITVLVATAFFLYLTIYGGINGTGYLWSFILPALAIFLLGIKIGGLVVFAYMILVILAFIHDFDLSLMYYSKDIKIRYFGSFSLISILMFLTEYVKSKALSILRKNNSELKKTLWKLQCTEEELRVSEVRYRTFVENFQGIAFQSNTQFEPYFFNGAVTPITGYSQNDFLCGDIRWQDIVHPDDKDLLHIELNDRNSMGNNESTYRIVTKDGSLKWIQHVIAKLKDGGNEYLQGTFCDVTEQKKIEQQLFQISKLDSIGKLAGGVAHDFNNLLTVIIGKSELLLLELKNNGRLYNDICEIKDTANRAADLTRQLLAFSRKQMIRPKCININNILKDMNTLLSRLIHENIELSYKMADNIWDVTVDPAQIDQVLTNIIVNARDAMTYGGKIDITTGNVVFDAEYVGAHIGSRMGEYVFVSIEDNGLGMDESTLSHAFEPFYTTKELGRGTGLGLATCYGIVKQNGGYIWIDSNSGAGTRVSFYLPRTQKSDIVQTKLDEKLDFRFQGRSVLLAEDEESVRTIIQRMLHSLGVTVLTADNGNTAYRIISEMKEPVDLVITDVVMPTMGGFELANKIARLVPDIPILFISGYVDESIPGGKQALQEKVLLNKPFTKEQLHSKLSRVFNKNKGLCGE